MPKETRTQPVSKIDTLWPSERSEGFMSCTKVTVSERLVLPRSLRVTSGNR